MQAPVIILVNPQMGENIGAAARAMLNFGIIELRLVNPRDGWPNQRADDMAAGALERMPKVTVFDTLEEAAADLHYLYATTARTRDMVKPVFTPHAAVQDFCTRQTASQRIALVFGAERTGLTNDETALCHAIITIPANPDFSSINLGQAVLLLAYEWFQAQSQTPDRQFSYNDSLPAPQAKLEEFFLRLEDELEAGEFFRAAQMKPTIMRNIRNIFTRAELSEQEVSTMQGVVSALNGRKAAHKKAAQ